MTSRASALAAGMALYRAARAALWQEIMDGGSVEAMALLVKHGADVKAHNASGDHALLR